MKNIIAAIICASVSGAIALAQTMPTVQEQTGSMPTAQSQSSSSQSSNIANSGNQNSAAVSEKKLKGCLISQGGKYVLQDKRGKEVALAGSAELGSHIGHIVTVRGTFANGDANRRSSATYSAAGLGGTFMVSKLDPISDSCGSDKNKLAEQVNSNGKPSPYHK
jgi:Protein of unknown function (DUF5818)